MGRNFDKQVREQKQLDAGELTDKKIKAYMDDPTGCPDCGSKDRLEKETDHIEIQEGAQEAFQVWTCECGFRWTDYYSLSGIEYGGDDGVDFNIVDFADYEDSDV